MKTPDTSLGAPYDFVLHSSSQLGDGTNLADGRDLLPIVARVVSLLARSAVGKETEALSNNALRALQQLTPWGEPAALGSPAILEWIYDGGEIAQLLADHALCHAASQWLGPGNDREEQLRERASANAAGVGDLDAFMVGLQRDEDGRDLLAPFDSELSRSWRGGRPKVRALPTTLTLAEDSYRARQTDARRAAGERARTIIARFVSALVAEAHAAVDRGAVRDAGTVIELALDRVTAMEGTLDRQRGALQEELGAVQSAAASALEALVEAVARVRTRWLRGIGKPLKVYVELVTEAFRLEFALALTEEAFSAYGSARKGLEAEHGCLEALALALDRSARQARERVLAYESRAVTPVEAIIDRPLHDADDLHALYEEACGSPWEELSITRIDEIRRRLGGLALLLDADEEGCTRQLQAAASSLFTTASAMTADGFVAWKSRRLGRAPELWLRDSELLAPLLCRVDKARLPEDRDLRETSFSVIGVPDRDTPVFLGTQQGILVTTGDPTRITFLRLTLGFPASSLWHFESYREDFFEVRRQGQIVQEIFRNFPYEIRQAWEQAAEGPPSSSGAKKKAKRPTRSSRRRSR